MPFPGGAMKPPPLLFSQPENISLLPHLNTANITAPEVKKKHIRYTEEFILSQKSKTTEKPKNIAKMDFPTKHTKKKKNEFFGRPRKYSNYKVHEPKFKKVSRRKMTVNK